MNLDHAPVKLILLDVHIVLSSFYFVAFLMCFKGCFLKKDRVTKIYETNQLKVVHPVHIPCPVRSLVDLDLEHVYLL